MHILLANMRAGSRSDMQQWQQHIATYTLRARLTFWEQIVELPANGEWYCVGVRSVRMMNDMAFMPAGMAAETMPNAVRCQTNL